MNAAMRNVKNLSNEVTIKRRTKLHNFNGLWRIPPDGKSEASSILDVLLLQTGKYFYRNTSKTESSRDPKIEY